MKFFGSIDNRVTLSDVARDIRNDEDFEAYLKWLHELPPEQKKNPRLRPHYPGRWGKGRRYV